MGFVTGCFTCLCAAVGSCYSAGTRGRWCSISKAPVQRSDVHRVVVVALESWRCSLGPGGQFMQSHRDLVLHSSLAMMVLSISTRNFGHGCSGISESIKPVLVWKPNSLFFSPSEGRRFEVKLKSSCFTRSFETGWDLAVVYDNFSLYQFCPQQFRQISLKLKQFAHRDINWSWEKHKRQV